MKVINFCLSLVLGAMAFNSHGAPSPAPTESEVLHATFVVFQKPGVLSVEEIQESRALLVRAAEAGSDIAQLVVDRSGQEDIFITYNPAE